MMPMVPVTMVGEASLGYAIVGVTDAGTTYLCGSRCPSCGDVRYPPRALCPLDQSVCEDVAMPGDGTVYETVKMSLTPQGFAAPMWVGYVDLDFGPRVFAQIHVADGETDPAHGDQVDLHIRPVKVDGDVTVHGPVFLRKG
jgi:uncharacterized OB-fold protein